MKNHDYRELSEKYRVQTNSVFGVDKDESCTNKQ